mgnify:CR=1 FL=1
MVTKKRSRGFPYKFCTFALIGAIAGVIYYDINQHGTWEKSQIYNGLKDFGVIQYYHNAINRTSDGLGWLHLQIDEQFPGYYETVSEHLAPYRQLGKEGSIIFYNLLKNAQEFVVKKYPVVLASIDRKSVV